MIILNMLTLNNFIVKNDFSRVFHHYQQSFRFSYERLFFRKGAFLFGGEATADFVFGDISTYSFDNDLALFVSPELSFDIKTGYGNNRLFFTLATGINASITYIITAHCNVGVRYYINKKTFVQLNVEHVVWNCCQGVVYPPSEECQECYGTIYDVWFWEKESQDFRIYAGLGIKF